MLCNICKTTNVIIKNGYYFCPSCKIFISKVSDHPEGLPQYFAPGMKIPEKIILDKPIKQTIFNKLLRLKYLSFIFTFFILFIFFRNFLYLDIPNKCYIVVYPSWFELSNSTIKKGISVIKTVSPENYQNLCQRVKAINPNLSCGGFEGGCFEPGTPKTIYVNATKNLIWVVDVIAHEACHALQFYENRPFDENECNAVGVEVMKTANGH